MDFEYLDKQDGFVVQIFHTGINQDLFNINGTLIGFGEVTKGKSSEKPLYDRIIDKFVKDKTKQHKVKLIIHLFMFVSFFVAYRSIFLSQKLTPIAVFLMLLNSFYFISSPTKNLKIPPG